MMTRTMTAIKSLEEAVAANKSKSLVYLLAASKVDKPLFSCEIRLHIKEGMTPAEKNEALDDAMEKYLKCLANRFRN